MTLKNILCIIGLSAWLTFCLSIIMHDSVSGLGFEQYVNMISR